MSLILIISNSTMDSKRYLLTGLAILCEFYEYWFAS